MRGRATRTWHNALGPVLAVAFLLVLPASCKEPDQIRIDLTTDVPCSAIDHVAIGIASTPARTYADLASGAGLVTHRCNGYFLGTIIIQPGSPNAAITAVLAYRGGQSAAACVASNFSDCIVGRRRVPFAGRPLTLTLKLAAECRGVACSLVSTCQGKRCLDSEVSCNEDDGNCPEPSHPPADDAGPPEAERDASTALDGSSDGGGDARDGTRDSGGDGGMFQNFPPTCSPTTCTGNEGCCYDPDSASVQSCRSSALQCMTTYALFVRCRRTADCIAGKCVGENVADSMTFQTYCGTPGPTTQRVCGDSAECDFLAPCEPYLAGGPTSVLKVCGTPPPPH